AALTARPMAGIEATPVPLAAGAALALAVIVLSVRASAVDDLEVDADAQYGDQSLATAREWEPYAHASATGRDDDGRRVAWPRPEWCERLEDDNFLLTEDVRLALTDNPARRWRPPNHHMFVIAGSGAGKTYNFVTTNVLQLNASYVFTDPKGELFSRFANLLERHGYEVRLLDLRPDEEAIRSSHGYNPLHYCESNTQVDDVVERLVKSTSSPESSANSNADWFTNMEKLAYGAIWKMELWWFAKNGNPDDYNVPSAYDWLEKLRLSGEAAQSELDLVFFATRAQHGFSGYREWVTESLLQSRCHGDESLLRNQPEWEPINNYEGFTSMAGSPETSASVLSSCYNRLRPFMNSAVREVLTRRDELDLDQLGTRKQALFILTADYGGPYDFLASMLASQLFAVNARVGDNSPGHHLPIPVVCYLDEIANIGALPRLPQLFATLRSRWINLVAITQYSQQLKPLYREGARGIMANSSVLLYLGAGDYETCEEISKMIGKHTVHHRERSITRSESGTSTQESTKYTERPVVSADELFNIAGDPNRMLAHIALNRWVEGRKPDPRSHPRFSEIGGENEVTDFVAWADERRRRRAEAAALPPAEWVDEDGRAHIGVSPGDATSLVIEM
ncbi:MAG: type IV secretory system conjugative DNA transfer family protein, partial [Olsenella sp.]|nr:type IV secretory system conjugative DNA transfer family protein [Olsenella sp.]